MCKDEVCKTSLRTDAIKLRFVLWIDLKYEILVLENHTSQIFKYAIKGTPTIKIIRKCYNHLPVV